MLILLWSTYIILHIAPFVFSAKSISPPVKSTNIKYCCLKAHHKMCLMDISIMCWMSELQYFQMLVWVDLFIHCALLLASLSFLFFKHFAFNFKRLYSCLSAQRHCKGTKMEVEKTNKAETFYFLFTSISMWEFFAVFPKSSTLAKHRETTSSFCFPKMFSWGSSRKAVKIQI